MASSWTLSSSYFGQSKGFVTEPEASTSATAPPELITRLAPRRKSRCVVSGHFGGDEWWKRPLQESPLKSAAKMTAMAAAGPAVAASPEFLADRPFELQQGQQVRILEREYEYASSTGKDRTGGVPVYVMLPLDSVNMNNQVNRRKAMNMSFQALKSAGVEGVMLDVWWGIVQKDGPHSYNWSGYSDLLQMAKDHGLKVQAVMSFHQCGGNVGDSVSIPLPPWVLDEVHRNPDMVYTDRYNNRNYEYLSLGCDQVPVVKGRTPIQVYADFMRSFRDTFKDLLGDVVSEIQVGMGPAGELRYPGYPERDGIWRFPGVGEFQCYDKYLLASLQASAAAIGKAKWGCPPSDAGHYKQWPEDSTFFKREGGWNSEYGKFFLEWYSGKLIEHGEQVLGAAEGIFRGSPVRLSGKIAGIHWHYGTRSHAPELTAGYYNTRFRDGYLPIARMFGRHGVTFNFTCFEMRDVEQRADAQCSPEGLLKQVTIATRDAGVHLAGENALPRYDDGAYEQIVSMSRLKVDGNLQSLEAMCSSFTFLRMNQKLFQPDNWRRFVHFVRNMTDSSRHHEQHKASELFVVTKPLVQEAAAAL